MIDEELKEVLGELINISFGSATATIADLFDSFATLHVPDIRLVPISEVEPLVMPESNGENVYITTQPFKGGLEGEITFTLDRESACKIQLIVDEEEKEEEEEPAEEEVRQSVLEISNILCSSCIGRLAEMLGSEVSFSPPGIDFSNRLLQGREDSEYSQVIIISTILEFQDMQFRGHLFIMFSDDMFNQLMQALENYIENI